MNTHISARYQSGLTLIELMLAATLGFPLGDSEAALTELDRAYDAGFRFVRWPPIEPMFDDLRNELRYREFMAKIEREVEAMRQRVLDQAVEAREG